MKGRKVTIAILLIVLAAILAYLLPYPGKIIFQIIIGAMLAHCVELLHELNHYKISQNDRLDRCIAAILGFPMLISPSQYKWSHSLHHKNLGTVDDMESFSYNFERLFSLSGFIVHISMIDHYWNTLKALFTAILGKLNEEIPPRIAKRIQAELRLMAALLIFLLVLRTDYRDLTTTNRTHMYPVPTR